MSRERVTFVVVIIILLYCISFSSAKTSFVKDQNEDRIQFPPKVIQQTTDIPLGHLRPLGWQKVPDGKIEELNEMPNPEDFYDQFVKEKKPVVFRKVLEDVPAMKNWNKKNYLTEKYGSINVDVVVKKELFTKGPKKMTVKKFLKEYNSEDWYLSNYVPLEMMHELLLPKCLKCGFRRWLMESEIWISSGGTASLLHSHADHDVHCLLAGRKDFILIKTQHKKDLAFHEKEPYLGSGYSEIDMDQINMFKYKNVSNVPWIWSTLRKGDCIFVPSGYLHQVRSYGRSISSTNHFSPSPELRFDDCLKQQLDKLVPLNEAGFLWTYKDGKLMLSNSRLTSMSMKHHLLMVMRDQDHLTYQLFLSFYDEVMEQAKDFPDRDSVWLNISPLNSSSITRSEVKDLSEEALQKLSDVFNIPHKEEQNKKKTKLKRDEL